MGGWLLGPALSKREDTMQRSFGSRGSLFLFHRKVRSDTGGKAYSSIYFKRIIRNENNI
jgi:hypothetical protein